MRVLFLSSEVAPFSKTGGLGDVGHALPRALAKLGHTVRVVSPLYQSVPRERLGRFGANLTLDGKPRNRLSRYCVSVPSKTGVVVMIAVTSGCPAAGRQEV